MRRKAQAFGSFAHGVSLPGADLDVVVSGIMTPISRGGGEFLRVPQSCCLLCGSRDADLARGGEFGVPFVVHASGVPTSLHGIWMGWRHQVMGCVGPWPPTIDRMTTEP